MLISSGKIPHQLTNFFSCRPKSTNLGSSNYSKSSTLPPKKQQPESEIPVAVNITSIYPEVVELICSNTKCERKIAEKTFSDIAQLVNASIACQVNDSLTAEVVAKLFHIKVDPAKNLLSSLSFALTVILNGGGQTPEQANEGSGEQNGELVAEDGSQVCLLYIALWKMLDLFGLSFSIECMVM